MKANSTLKDETEGILEAIARFGQNSIKGGENKGYKLHPSEAYNKIEKIFQRKQLEALENIVEWYKTSKLKPYDGYVIDHIIAELKALKGKI